MTTATDFDGSATIVPSETDASNSGASPGGMPDNTAPSNLKLIIRAQIGAVQRWYDRDHAVSGGTVGGTANAITLAYTTPPNAWKQGQTFEFLATAANTGATTFTPNSGTLTAKNVFKKGTSGVVACAGGEIQSGDLVRLSYDGTQLQIMNQPSNATAGVASVADATNGGLNFSASTGAVTAKLQPSDLATKASPTISDSVVLMDAAASNVAKTATLPSLPISAKAWVNFNGSGVIQGTSYNIASVSRSSAGAYTVTLSNALSDTTYVAVATTQGGGASLVANTQNNSASVCAVSVVNGNTGNPTDAGVNLVIFGV